MKTNKGITMVALIITIILLLIIAGVTIGSGSGLIKESQLENQVTNMLLIKSKGKEYVENANFKLGTNIDEAEDKTDKINNAKSELKGTETDISTYSNIEATESEYVFYYVLNDQDLSDMGFPKLKSNESDGFFIIQYDIKNAEVEVYNTNGYTDDNGTYYSLTEMQELE